VGIAFSYLKQAPPKDLSSKPPLTRVILGRCPRPPKPFLRVEVSGSGRKKVGKPLIVTDHCKGGWITNHPYSGLL